MPLPFNKNLDLKLLKLVKENSILYNTRHAKYLDFDAREVIWQKIGDSLGRPAVQFAGIQCQVQLGDYQEGKHKPGFIENLEEYLPAQYSNAWNIEKKIFKEFALHQGKTPLEAKFLYIKTARAMPTYGVTFFLVKEKQYNKKKLVPRLLGINAEAILRLDEVTKEILQQWPLTHVKTYHAGKSQTFTLNFGDYSDKEYSVKTQHCHRIRDILEGYIDIIRRRMLAPPAPDVGDSMAIVHDNVQMGKSNIIEHVSNSPSKMVTESYVGPNRIVTSDQGSHGHSGAQLTTIQQIVVTDHLKNQQFAIKGEIPLRGDMSPACVEALNKLNTNSVKIVGLLTDPTDSNVKEAQKIVQIMQGELPLVQQGIKETAEKQTVEEMQKKLLDELQDLNNYLNKLSDSTKPGHVDPNEAKNAAENIADLTTQMFLSIDPKSRRRSELLRRSRRRIKAGEAQENSVRRESFVAAATTALHAVDTAAAALRHEYSGPEVDEGQRSRLERALEDRTAKLNAAIALYLTAHSDPENIDYAAAINSMNAINELMPKLARDAQMLASTKDPAARKELLDEMQALFDATKKVCGMTGTGDHEKIQEASNQYADVAGKLIFMFARGSNSDNEKEIIQLAKEAGARTSKLLVTANELTCQEQSAATAAVDRAGLRTAAAARDLLACAQLSAPAIHEPHCQSALTAAAEGLSSSLHSMEAAWKPLLEDPTRQHMSDTLHHQAMDVSQALERLKDAYSNVEGGADNELLPLQERRRLQFIATAAATDSKLQGVEDMEKSESSSLSEQEKQEADRRLGHSLAQLNAAVAALLAATADRENPDYATAELAMATISELMPQIVKDADAASSDKREAWRALAAAARCVCAGQDEAASKFAEASGKLMFLISPGADKGKQKQVLQLSSKAQQQASQLAEQGRRLQPVAAPAAAELGQLANRTDDAARALHKAALVTSTSIDSPRCQDTFNSSVRHLHNAAGELVSACRQAQPDCAAIEDSQRQLADTLQQLAQICQMGPTADTMGTEDSAEKEKKRLQFINSMSGAKRRLDAAALQLTKPMPCQMMTQEHAEKLEDQVAEKLGQLNAAVAALVASTADRENPDYAAAENAVSTITSMMPHFIQDSRKLCGTKTDEEQAAMSRDLRALCEATRDLCNAAGKPEGVGDAVAKYSAASSNLVFCVTPAADNAKENEVMGLSADSCGKASELLSLVQRLTEQVPEAGAAAELDSRGARTADAAQALLTVAQATAASIAHPQCRAQLLAAAGTLRGSANTLTGACAPHLLQRPDLQQQLPASHQQLNESLDKLVDACNSAQPSTRADGAKADREKRQLQFVNSLSGAKNRIYDAEQQLQQPLTKHSLNKDDTAALEQKLSERLAKLNAAVAALAAARADVNSPDYAVAEQSVKEISELMPLIVQDYRKLSSTKEEADRAAMLDDLRALCQASRSICESIEDPGPLLNTTEFNKASNKLVFLVSPKPDNPKDQQKLEVLKEAHNKAQSHVHRAQAARAQLDDAAQAQVSPTSARVLADASHMVAAAHMTNTNPSNLSAIVILAAEKLRGSAADLTASLAPHLQHAPHLQQQLVDSQRDLDDSIERVKTAYREQDTVGGVPSPQAQEQQRLRFVSTISGAKDRLDAVDQQLKEPILCQTMRQEDGVALQHQLSDRLARLNAAVAALAAATADRKNLDYAAADQAICTISELMPQVVQDSRKLCGTKTDEEQVAMSRDLRALCDVTRELCDAAGKPEGIPDAAAKYSEASGKLLYIISPKTQSAHEQQVISLSAESCGKASELLSVVQRLTEQVPDAGAAAELDNRGAHTADAAQALLTVAQATAASIAHAQCREQLLAAAGTLRSSADTLTGACAPHLPQRPDLQQQLQASHQQLNHSLDELTRACKAAQLDTVGGVTSPQEQERQRLRFVSTISGAKDRLDAVDQLLKEPILCQTMRQEDGVALQHQLSDRVARLNAAVAALAAATADRKNPDYAAADEAIRTISELMPQVVQDSRKLCGTKTDEEQVAMSRDLRALCDVTRDLCDAAGKPEGIPDAAAKYSEASGKLLYIISPKSQSAHEQQVVGLSADSCGKASELLSLVQRLTEQVQDVGVAAELDSRGAHTADAAQALLTVAQTTAGSIAHAQCREQLLAAAGTLRGSADTLWGACAPHLPQRPDLQEQLQASHQQLNDSLDDLIRACKAAQKGDVVLSPQQEQERIKFVSSVSGAKKHLDTAEQQLNKPVIFQTMSGADKATLQSQLSRRLAQLNAAVAALTAATSDGKNLDYPAAERSVTTITELIPQVVQDCHKLCGSMEPAVQAAAVRQLHQLCGAARDVCDSAGNPQKMNEASAKLANASGKLVNMVNPDAKPAKGPKPGVAGSKPAVPARESRPAAHPRPHHATQTFLDTLRAEESQDKVKIVGVDVKGPVVSEEEKHAQKQFLEMIDSAETGLQTAEDRLKLLYNAKSMSASGAAPAPAQVARAEQHMEDTLARAAVHVADLVAANYADKLDYKAAMAPTVSLTKSVRSVVEDGSAICDALPEKDRKTFLDDMTGLCQATKSICEAAKCKKEKLNEAAISFGDQSVKLLRVVSCDINPSLEKEVISRAKAIGDTASRLALEASNVATAASAADVTGTAGVASPVQDICTAGTRCVDAAGKLVYTAKLIAPTIHHSTCQETLISSADNLSSHLTTFSKTWSPLTTSQQPSVHKLTAEAAHLEELVENLRRDVKSGKLGRSRDFEPVVNVDSVLRQLAVEVFDTAKDMVEYGDLSPEQKKEYISYSGRLQEAIRLLDLANARFQRAPRDRNKRNDLEIATQDLQMTLLQTRPSRTGQEQSYVVDFRDFLQDLVKEADDLQEAARKNESVVGKGTADDIKLLCSKISEDAQRLLNPTDYDQRSGTIMTCADDVMDIDVQGQECEVLVKEINSAIQGIQDQKVKAQLRAKLLPLTESCHLLRFATQSHIESTRSALWEDTLRNLDSFEELHIEPLARAMQKITPQRKEVAVGPVCSGRRAGLALVRARGRAARADPAPLCHALAYAVVTSARPRPQTHTARTDQQHKQNTDGISDTVNVLKTTIRDVADACMFRTNIQHPIIGAQLLEMLARSEYTPLLSAEDIDKLLLIQEQHVEGTPKQLQDKLQQLATQLSSLAGTVLLSARRPQSLARSLHASADLALLLANTARALKDNKRPTQCQKVEEAVHEMCTSTYSLLKASEIVCQNPDHQGMRRKLTDASRQLNESINQLVLSVEAGSPSRAALGEVQRGLQLQRSVLQSAPHATAALSYAHCLDSLRDQRDVLHKLKSDQSMSREEFFKSMNYVASAISNSTECAAQAAYLLSVSDKDNSIGKLGPVDVGKMQKSVEAVENTCVSVIVARHSEHGQLEEETSTLKGQVQDLLDGLDDAISKTKEGELKTKLKECKNDITQYSKEYYATVQKTPNDKDEILVKILKLMYEVEDAGHVLQDKELVPTASEVPAETQKLIDEVIKNSLALVSHKEELLKEVRATPEEQKVMTWVMYNKRRDVLDAFENLLKSIQSSGQRVKLLEGSAEEPEGEKKSYVQKQFDAASKWLLKPVSKAEIKTNGQQAVRNLTEVANKITEDLKGTDKEDMRNLVQETEQLLTACSQKYDHEQYSLLMERVRELKKAIERGVVTRVVEDFMEAEAPLADLDLLADYEKDESKRKLILERKIAELLAQLARLTRTARLTAHTDTSAGGGTLLHSCSEQAELLAPMLVKAAQQRVSSPDDKVVIERYKSLLAKYTDSLSQIRDLCDQSVDPMDFVQTAGETMERMREESTKHNDPMKCAHTSNAITKLANRVIHVGLSSNEAASDPELKKLLSEAQLQLSAATPPAGTRASKMPDWKDTTAKILQATETVEAVLGGEAIFNTQPGPNQPIYNEALNLHVAIRDWSSRDNEIVAVAKRMAVLMAKLSNFMSNDKQREVLMTSKSIVTESHEVARLAKKLAHECTDHRIKTNLLQTCERIPTISGQLKMLTTVKGFSLGRHGTQEDKEALDMLVGNAQSLMLSIQDVVKGAASASVKIMSQRGPRMKWVRKNVY